MANITFAWMVDRVQESTGLTFNENALLEIADRYVDGLEQLIQREVPDSSVYRGWGVGPIIDSHSSQSLTAQVISGEEIRTPGQYRPDINPGEEASKDVANVHCNSQEYIHSVYAAPFLLLL